MKLLGGKFWKSFLLILFLPKKPLILPHTFPQKTSFIQMIRSFGSQHQSVGEVLFSLARRKYLPSMFPILKVGLSVGKLKVFRSGLPPTNPFMCLVSTPLPLGHTIRRRFQFWMLLKKSQVTMISSLLVISTLQQLYAILLRNSKTLNYRLSSSPE